jgi:hypothetical protein
MAVRLVSILDLGGGHPPVKSRCHWRKHGDEVVVAWN